jgi:hypothetical protein
VYDEREAFKQSAHEIGTRDMNSTTRCTLHPAFEVDNCPSCGTSRPVGMTTEQSTDWQIAREKGELVSWLIEHDTSDRIISAEYDIETLRQWKTDVERLYTRGAELMGVEARIVTRVCPVCQQSGTPIAGRCEFCDSIIDEKSPEFAAAHGEQWNDDDTIGEPDDSAPTQLLNIAINISDSDAMQCNAPAEVRRLLQRVIDRLDEGEDSAVLFDTNGARVGNFSVTGA